MEEETTQQRYKEAIERIFASKQINEKEALAIYAMGPEAVVFALLTLHSQKQSDVSSIESSPAEELSRPSATIPPYQKPNQGNSRKKKPGRKSGFIGTSRRTPEKVTRDKEHKLEECPDCGGSVSHENTPRSRVIEDLPEDSTSEVTRHVIYRAWCQKCRKKVEPVVTDALPNSQIGIRLMVFTAWLHYALGTTISQVLSVLNFHLCIKLTSGALSQAWQRLAQILKPWYQELEDNIKQAKVIHSDETSWRIDGRTHWVWCIASSTTTFFMIERSRGSPALKKFFTEVFEGTLVTDFWGAYNSVMTRSRQMCLVHLLREISNTSKYKSPRDDWARFAKSLKRLLKDSMRLWYRKDSYSADRYESRSRRLSLRLRILCEREWKDPNCKRLVKRLIRHEEHLFTFVNKDGVPFDNNHCEREIRSAVVMRKNSYGNRSLAGAEAQAILMSIFRTMSKTSRNPISEIVAALKVYLQTKKLPNMNASVSIPTKPPIT
jgi:transposase